MMVINTGRVKFFRRSRSEHLIEGGGDGLLGIMTVTGLGEFKDNVL